MPSIIETIKQRTSIRTYDSRKVESNKKEQLLAYIQSNQTGPFGSKVRFQLVETTENERRELKELGTYGSIKGAWLFIAGAVQRGPKAMEDFGYCMEKNILKATELGLGTCWLGGSLNRSAFAKKINAAKDELIPAVTPLGYPAAKRSLRDNAIRVLARTTKRKEFGELFYDGSLSKPLVMGNNEKYYPALEAVRVAPSASNKQPWRIIKETGRDVFHFYLKENRIYNRIFGEIKLQNLDMGVAICHFESVARELGLAGSWKSEAPELEANGLEYIVSWVGI